jgi:hypothetical protein
MATRRPLIDDDTAEIILVVAFVVLWLPLYGLWRAWRALRGA